MSMSRTEPAAMAGAGDNPRPRVVVIDASAAAISLYERSVKALGVELAVFESSQTALAYLKHNRAELIFLELMVPGQDGLSLLEELRAHGLSNSVPIVIVTSKDYLQDRSQAARLGASEFLAKPLRSQELRKIIKRYIQTDGA